MKMNEHCLPCLVNQVIKVAEITNADHREDLYKQVFTYLSEMDFNLTNPEIIGATFQLLKDHINNQDPYKEIRDKYNELFMGMSEEFEQKIQSANDTFLEAIKYSIVGNMIDFNPIHNLSVDDIMEYFKKIDSFTFTVNQIPELRNEILTKKSLLFIGDNCGEICLDRLLLKEIKRMNPDMNLYFATRGYPVVNDSIEEDAYKVGIDEFATIISNGDNSLGTVIHRTSPEFQKVYHDADIVIAKGSANYESLSDEARSIYFMFMVKCQVMANATGEKMGSIMFEKKD